MRSPCVMFGIPIDAVTMDDTLDLIDEFVVRGRRHRRLHQIATVNVDFLVNAVEHPDLFDLLQQTELNLADGMPLVWASPRLGAELPCRVAGSDLVPLLARESATRGWRVHLFGAAPGVADTARDLLLARYPGAHLTSDAGPVIRDVDDVDDAVFERIADHEPDIVCVAFGNPKQERFIHRHRDRFPGSVAVGIGGSLDMLLGLPQRAPEWVQQVGAEWIYRAAQEPRRLGPRYAHDLRIFLPHVARYVRTAHRFEAGPPIGVELRDGVLTAAPGIGSTPPGSWDDATAVHLALGSATALGLADHALLIGLQRFALRRGLPIDAQPWPRPLVDQFAALCTTELLVPLADGPDDSHRGQQNRHYRLTLGSELD